MSLAWLVPLVLAMLALAVFSVRQLAALDEHGVVGQIGTPLLFGAWVLAFWELLTQALDVPRVLLPAPSLIAHALLASYGVLAGDFAQTVETTVYTRFPKDGPLGLQHLPPAFESPTAANKHAARFVFAEYHHGHDDISIAVDTRSATGPTLVYLEMLTSFS